MVAHVSRLRILLLAMVGAFIGCSAPPLEERRAAEAVASPPATAVAARPAARPRLVVAIVIDQLPAWALERYLPHLDEDGLLRRAATGGARHTVVFEHAATYTAPGHAAIFTGASPRDSGIISNEVYDRARDQVVAVVDDGKTAVFGKDGGYATPGVLLVPTVADALAGAEPDARIVAVSLKDRGALFGAGKRGDIAIWYEKSLGHFTTSRHYAEELPAWLDAWQDAHPLEDALSQPWEAERPELYARLLGPDDEAGEADYHGLGTTFPHRVPAGKGRPAAARVVPAMTDYMLALADAAARQYEMGADDVPDLLTLSVSTTDYVGHAFGPDSWEYLDHLVRVDRALAAFVDQLAERTELAVIITSDHGAAALPEREAARGAPAGRLQPEELAAAVDAALDEVLGKGRWVRTFGEPILYLTEAARAEAHREKALAAAIARLESMPGVARAFAIDAADALARSDDPLERMVGASIPRGFAGEVFVVPAAGYVVDPDMARGHGSSHGSPWDYDREVPALLYGVGVTPREASAAPLPQRRVAATLAALLGIAPPAQLAGVEPLPGAPAAR